MTTYWLTFRLHDATVGNRRYEDRYNDLRDTIRSMSVKWWYEPTSFFLFSSSEPLDRIAGACKQAIATGHDMFLVRELDTKAATICGKVDDRDVFALIPYLKTL